MNQKPLPPPKDVKELARQFRKLWVPGQGMRPYLRKHAALFHQLRQDGWSWAGLALAMTTAGVMYQTKKPWTAETLLPAFSRAQLPLKGHAGARWLKLRTKRLPQHPARLVRSLYQPWVTVARTPLRWAGRYRDTSATRWGIQKSLIDGTTMGMS